MTALLRLACVVALIAAIAGPARAGSSYSGAYASATLTYGTLKGFREASDPGALIRITVYSSSAYVYAVHDGNAFYCSTTDASYVEKLRQLSENARFSVYANSAFTCTGVSLYIGSEYR